MISHMPLQLLSTLKNLKTLRITAIKHLVVIQLHNLASNRTTIRTLLLVIHVTLVTQVVAAWLDEHAGLDRELAFRAHLGLLREAQGVGLTSGLGTRRLLPEQKTTWLSQGGQFGYLSAWSPISYTLWLRQIQQYQAMLPRTPQKKKSLQVEPRTEIANSSYIFSVPNSSGVGQAQPEIQLKSSQGNLNLNLNLNLSNKNNKIHNTNNKMSLVRKYVQQEMQSRGKYGKDKESKEYREVVISDEFVRSHHLYKMLKEQMAIADARHLRETNTLAQMLEQADREVKEIKEHNHHVKVQLWEHKTQFMELKSMLEEEEEDNKKLVEEYEYANRDEGEGEEGAEGEEGEGEGEGEEGEGEGEEEEIFQGEEGRNLEQGQGNEGEGSKWQKQLEMESKDRLKQILDQIKRGEGDLNLLPMTHSQKSRKQAEKNNWDLQKQQQIKSLGECSNKDQGEQEELEMQGTHHK